MIGGKSVTEINTNTYYDIENIGKQVENTRKPKANNELEKDDFLRLLVTQLKYQNPLEPLEGTEFVSQLAQFGALEQMQNLNLQMASLSATSIIGKTAKAIDFAEDGKEMKLSGTIEGITFDRGRTMAIIQDENSESEIAVPLEKLYEIR